MDAEAKAHSQEWLCHEHLPLGGLEMGLDIWGLTERGAQPKGRATDRDRRSSRDR